MTTENNKETYEIWTRCDNCGSLDTIKIPKGTEQKNVLKNTMCKYCDCKGLTSAGPKWPLY